MSDLNHRQASEHRLWKKFVSRRNAICVHFLSLMAEGRLEPKRVITHRFHYSELVKAYEMAYHREKSMLGVVFSWKD